jgi:hypothetical protein
MNFVIGELAFSKHEYLGIGDILLDLRAPRHHQPTTFTESAPSVKKLAKALASWRFQASCRTVSTSRIAASSRL